MEKKYFYAYLFVRGWGTTRRPRQRSVSEGGHACYGLFKKLFSDSHQTL